MINKNALRKLEYAIILGKVSSFAFSPTAKQKALDLLPTTDFSEIQYRLRLTSEATQYINRSVVPDFVFDDVSGIAEKAKIMSTLTFRELLTVMRLLKISRNLKSAIISGAVNQDSLLHQMVMNLYVDKNFEEEIDFCIVSDEQINDRASDELYSLRKKIQKTNSDIREKLNSYTKSKDMAPFLQDSIVTMRAGRYVIPVKQECKNAVSGIIHDQSASGSTVFIEPIAIVNLNNDLRTLLIQESEEIERIMKDFTQRVGHIADRLMSNQNIISDVDVTFAKALYAVESKAVLPIMNENGFINIIRGRHPMIAGEKVVPVSITLGKNFNIVVITGPNTGGKTVCLKTVGLFCLMAYTGLFVPSGDGTELSVFEDIFCDIGDEQSIEQSLSTFSSHITNISNIVNNVTDKSLVLLDEVCAGTEPNEGAALALAITDFVRASHSKAVLTTHYGQLKEYSLVTDGVENASMEFDPTTFAPTYKLILGVPCSSNAIEIASSSGLNRAIVSDARSKLSTEKITFEKVLQNAEKIRQQYEEQKTNVDKTQSELAQELEKAKDVNKHLVEEREKLLKNSRIEARQIVVSAQEESQELIEQLKQIVNRAGLEERSLFEARSLAKKISDKKYITADNDKDYVFTGDKLKADEINIGMKVYVGKLNSTALVMSIEKGKKVAVKIGSFSTVVSIDDLYECEQAEQKQTIHTVHTKIRSGKVENEINLLGQTVDEAIMNLDKFIDEAVMGGLSEVRIVHGVGTGKLRKGVQDYLRTHRNVDEFRLGLYGEGETGVTIVKLK